MTMFLADGNLLVALTVEDHVHHTTALRWFEESKPQIATCPITEGTLLRFLIREGHVPGDACAVLEQMRDQPWCQFWADSIPYEKAQLVGVLGHRQVTDAYLVALARHNNAQVATFDRGLAGLHSDVVHLLEPSR